jgi:hypothetical protein
MRSLTFQQAFLVIHEFLCQREIFYTAFVRPRWQGQQLQDQNTVLFSGINFGLSCFRTSCGQFKDSL